MNQSLVPTAIVDKNGKRTIVRRKPVQAAADQKALPVPAAASEPRRTVPTEDQRAQKTFEYIQTSRNIDVEVAELTGVVHTRDTLFSRMSFEASDEQVYSVMSVTSHGNAGALLAYGMRSKEDAMTFLADNDLERMLVDNTGLTDEAMRRGLSAKHLTNFLADYDQNDADSKTVVDAAFVASKDRYRTLTKPSAALMVLQGEITLSQIEDIEINRITREDDRKQILKALKAINAGEATYDTKQLRSYLDAVDLELSEAAAVILADGIGIDHAMLLQNKVLAYQSIRNFQRYGVPKESLGDFALFYDQFVTHPNSSGLRESVRLFNAGIDPLKAASLLGSGMSVETIIEAEQLGVHTSITEGFL